MNVLHKLALLINQLGSVLEKPIRVMPGVAFCELN